MAKRKRMKLSRHEKQFWQRYFRIDKATDIPEYLDGFKAVDSDYDDDFFYFLSLRVKSISEIHLKESLVTDVGVKYISGFAGLKNLYLRKHPNITKTSIPYFNEMKDLESLNITKTSITLTDLCKDLNNAMLKEVFLSSSADDGDLLEKGFMLKERMPNCAIYLDTSFTTNVFDHPVQPIF